MRDEAYRLLARVEAAHRRLGRENRRLAQAAEHEGARLARRAAAVGAGDAGRYLGLARQRALLSRVASALRSRTA